MFQRLLPSEKMLWLLVFIFGLNHLLVVGKPIVIAHRGASGYLPPHTLQSKAMAIGMGADYIEQDLVLTRDDVLIVMHDLHLDTTTNVAQVYPARNRSDGRYYAIDFDWSEIRQLKKTSTFRSNEQGEQVPVFPERFPLWQSRFLINTFEQEIQMVLGLEKSTGLLTGIYPEIKNPQWHREQGHNISRLALETLRRYNYTTRMSKCFLQCFDAAELKGIRQTLMPALGMDLNLVQLLPADGYQPENLREIAAFAQGVGPYKGMIVLSNSTAENLLITPMVEEAHSLGLLVHPWTFRSDPGQIPSYAKNMDDLLRIFFDLVKVDGVFTDFTDQAVAYLHRRGKSAAS